MKLRVQASSIRLRLMRSEVARLQEAGAVEEVSCFPGGGSFTYRIASSNAGRIQAALNGSSIAVHVPAGEIHSWATSDEVGLYAQDGPLKIAIEKDFRCLTRPNDPEEANAYPHPAEPIGN